VLGITNNLPNEVISVREADNCGGVVPIGFGYVNKKPIVNPIYSLNMIRHAPKKLQNALLVLAHEKFVKLLGGVGRRSCLKISVLSRKRFAEKS
jgi:hypothetical protein